jgi:hypothetical protein
MVGDDHLGAAPKLIDTIRGGFGGFDLDVDGMCAAADRNLENRELFLDAAVEFAVILMAAARCENEAFRKLL